MGIERKANKHQVFKEQVIEDNRVQVKDLFLDDRLTLVLGTPSVKDVRLRDEYLSISGSLSNEYAAGKLTVGLYLDYVVLEDEYELKISRLNDLYDKIEGDHTSKVIESGDTLIESLDPINNVVFRICEKVVGNFISAMDSFADTAITGELLNGFTEEDYDKYILNGENRE